MALKLPPKKPLTKSDIEWCNEILSKYEPMSEEEYLNYNMGEELTEGFDKNFKVNFYRLTAYHAKKMLERGYK